mmetsp:Transcript_19457/g.28840  ORF Transcript_19457/g.28840 Transcript_19457/m.28840 type:complete len:206 (-) Transcript_19457:3829-4446(-)
MAATKNRKKKRISKHVLKSKEAEQQSSDLGQSSDSPAVQTMTKTARQPKQSEKIKDPKEAETYLSAWKYREQGGEWKFNKNTQSWLFRHMYHAEKISKDAFTLLMEYMDGLKGSTRKRVIEDAQRRAVRYKEFEKMQEANKNVKTPNDNKANSASMKEMESETTSTIEKGGEDDQTRWKRLGNHDKRKEYKRARKVLELFQKESG